MPSATAWIWLKMTKGRKRQLYILPDTSSSLATRKFFDKQVFTPRFLAERFFVDPKEPFDAIAERIEQVRPDVVYSYGSYLEQFSRYLRNQRHSAGMPKLWVYGADTLTEPCVIVDELGPPSTRITIGMHASASSANGSKATT